MTIRKRLLLYILVPLISALVIFSSFDYFYSSWFLEKKASLMLLSGARVINNEIRQSIRQIESDLAILLSNRMIKEYVMYSRLGLLDYAEDERWKIEEDFLKVADEKPEYVSIRFIGLGGKSTIDIIDKKISYGHFHFSKEAWFLNALQLGKEESFVSPLHLCKEHMKRSISISRLYYDDAGERGGVISLHIHVQEFFKGIIGKTIGEKGHAYLIDDRGVIVAHKYAAGVGAAVNDYESSKRVIAGETGTITGFDVISAALMKKAYLPLQVEGLYLVLSQPLKEISEFGIQLQSFNLIFLIATVLLVSIISSVVAEKISKPIKELHHGTEIIESGNMDYRIEIKTGDEIQQLAAAFNKMVAGLKEKNDKLRESEEKLRAIFDNAMDGILVADVEEKKFFAGNNRICRMLGYSMEEIKGLRVMNIHPREDVASVMDYFESQAKGKFTLAGDIPVKRKDGTVFYADINSSPVTLAGKTYLVGIFRDITKRKRAEEELRASEERFRMITNTSSDMIHLNDREGQIIFANPATERLLGYPVREILNTFAKELIHPDDRAIVKQDMGSLLRGEAMPAREIRLLRQDGTYLEAEASGFVIKTGKEEKQIGAILRDITERKKAEEKIREYSENLEHKVRERTKELEEKTKKLENSETALRYLFEDVNETRRDLEKANEKLKELDRLKSMFIASMSHELRTPLNSIIGFTGLMLAGMAGEINDEQRDQLQRVYASAKHLLALISDVIDISKIEAGKVEVYAEEFSLAGIITEAVSSLKTEIEAKGLDLEVAVSPGIRMKTDRRRLFQCILNFLSNAVKFSESGTVCISAREVMVSDKLATGNEQHAAGFVEISVTDTGIGIREEDLSQLFKSFVRLDSPLKTTIPGTGLGLYLTKKLAVEVLGGSVSAESRHGEGSMFLIRIPKEI